MQNNDLPILILSALIIIGFGLIFLAWMIWPPAANSNVMSMMVGAIVSGYGQVIGYWFYRPKA
ncbi:hypothetical protein IVA80_15355 [Bradyrhizobium sp. 139]|uniref:hypothetical protein n=1 Tax=Bradyrhizobium sp. 139 TaxID=2782616 RepID=UPI001FF848E0|nr:hypothetical protein [Bradyrhizobium sp. 139]MCK1742201.1 hypothetical protein [Bradyrhizobium sp. 139]